MKPEKQSVDAVVRKIVQQFMNVDAKEIDRSVVVAKFFMHAGWSPETNLLVSDAAAQAVWQAFKRLCKHIETAVLQDAENDPQGDFAALGWNEKGLRSHYPVDGRKLVAYDLLTLPQWQALHQRLGKQVEVGVKHRASIATYVEKAFGVSLSA